MPTKVHCAHILVKTEKEVNAILERLKKGEKFGNQRRQIVYDTIKKVLKYQ